MTMTGEELGGAPPRKRTEGADVSAAALPDGGLAGGGRDRPFRRAGWIIVLSFWAIQFVELTLSAFATDGSEAWRSVLPRCLVMIVGIALSLVIVAVARRNERRPFRTRLLQTFATALATWLALAAINYALFRALVWERSMADHPAEYIYTAFSWSWFFLTMACATVAVSYGADAREKEAKLAAMEATAKDARLLALRYQLNPHFLFNALNSVAALVAGNDAKAAEATVENLADFLRAGLEIEPRQEITLAREIDLQAMYLAVEKVRFGDRLTVTIAVPDDLRDARVPALILQPLVENAMRHAVAGTAGPVAVVLAARVDGERLALCVIDDARPDPSRARRGTGLGIANVQARLSAHFGMDYALQVGPRDAGGFAARLSLPLRRG